MSDIKIQPSGSGTAVVTLTAPTTNTARTITFPDATGTLALTTGDDDKLLLTGGTLTGDVNILKTSGNSELKVESSGTDAYATVRLKNDAKDYSMQIRSDQSDAWTVRDETAGANRLFIESGGDIKVSTGNLYFGTAGKGIILGSTSGNTANLLDDYKEGTWVPVATCASGSFGGDPGNYGYYTKVGNLVYINGVIPNIPLSSASGAITITGLPYTSKTVSGSQTRHGFQLSSRQEYYTTEDNQPIFQVRSNSTTIDVINADGTWHSATEVSDLTNYWYPMFSGYYLV